MAHRKHQSPTKTLWDLVSSQHGVVSRPQLLALGLTREAVKHRIVSGRLRPVFRGVYAVGRPELSKHGRWMAAVLACGPKSVLSHDDAAALWQIFENRAPLVHVSVLNLVARRRPGVAVHRRSSLKADDLTELHGIPVTAPACTLIDLATRLSRSQLETAVNEADKRDLVSPNRLRSVLEAVSARPGVRVLRQTLDRRTFTLTDSALERRFLPIARNAGLPLPQTGRRVNGFKVDFYWPELGLIVETDGLRYHRTPVQQARDRVRDQAHAAAGLTPLRFTRAQVRFDPEHVQATLAAVARRLRRPNISSV
jgi:very-short-patch-repair endonuclease